MKPICSVCFFSIPSWDSVTISDGTTTNKYCGTTIPSSISSSTGSLSVNFIADTHTGAAGFEFDYACNSIGTTTPSTTTTTSPGGNYISHSYHEYFPSLNIFLNSFCGNY